MFVLYFGVLVQMMAKIKIFVYLLAEEVVEGGFCCTTADFHVVQCKANGIDRKHMDI